MSPHEPGENMDEELSSWAEDFRAPAAEPLSAEAVLREAARGARQERLAWVSQLGGLVFAIAVFLGLVVRSRSALLAGLSAVVLPTLLALFGFFIHVRQSIGKNADASVASFVTLTTRRRQGELKLLQVNRAALGFLAAVFWLWLPLFVLSRAERFAAQPWRLAVATLFSLAVFGGAWWRLGRLVRRARGDLARWRELAASFDESKQP